MKELISNIKRQNTLTLAANQTSTAAAMLT